VDLEIYLTLYNLRLKEVTNMVNKEVYEKLATRIYNMRDEMVETLGNLIKIPALGPRNQGQGELEKAEYLVKLIDNFGFDEIARVDAPDEDVESGLRPNIIAKIKGKGNTGVTIWIVTHTDIVPPGDMSKWETDPYEPIVKNGKIYGRGTEDNGQSLVASLYAVKALIDEGIKPEFDVGLAFMADEETGSGKGIKYVIKQGLFNPEDLIIVPDSGNEQGTQLEVSEKSIMWLKITTTGQQCHGSMPDNGINAFKAAMKFGVLADKELYEKFNFEDPLFDPPRSTFEPTMKDANVPNINTIPGEDVFYMDCRVMPNYQIENVIEILESLSTQIESETGAKVKIEKVMEDKAAPPTAPDAPVVEKLKEAVNFVYNNDPQPGGIGGGTCAAIFRREGYPAVVWSKIDNTCHGPNEYSNIDNLVNDAKVYAALLS
jgi:succinyl-diaminopimelate desuccinylase